MMNQDPENQQNGKTDEQLSQEHTQEQRKILEDRLAEINARHDSTSTSADILEVTPSVEEHAMTQEGLAAEEAIEVAAPVVDPEKTQSSVLASEEYITPLPTEAGKEEGPSDFSSDGSSAAKTIEEDNTIVDDSLNHQTASDSQEDSPVEEKISSSQASQQEIDATPTVAVIASAAPQDSSAENSTQPESISSSASQTDTGLSKSGSTQSSPQNQLVSVTSEESHQEEDENHHEEDFTHLPVEEIRARILILAQEGNARKTGRVLNNLYKVYDQHFQQERQEALNRFTAEGGSSDDFDYNAPREHKDVEQAMQRFRENRYKEQRNEEEQKSQNLQRKKDLLERLRELIESSETQTSGNAIKELQNEWKSIGQVPTAEAQQLWNSYHALLDIYYNNRSIFFELKELDRKRNLDVKTLLCDRAEALAKEENINKALQELRHLHDEWKHIGPVPNEARDQIWNRFIQASEQVHDRKKAFFDTRRAEETVNLENKRTLLAQIEQFQNFSSDRINDWRDKTDQIQKLKESWDAAGLVPKENAEEVNKAFWSSYKSFFHHKNTFFKALDEEKMQNYRQKVALCEEAESQQSSEEWDSTKEKLIQLQKKWKTIGRVPDKYSDKIWNRFRTACNAFFDRLHQEAQHKETQLNQVSAQKLGYCEQLASKVTDPTFIGSQEEFNQIHQEWKAMHSEGKRNPKLEDRFQQLLAKYLDKVPEMNPQQKEQTLFQLQLNHLKASPDGDQKIFQKEQHLRRDITSLENDISTLKTNIEFFARSKNAEKLREEYQTKIDEAQNRIQHLKRQLKSLRS